MYGFELYPFALQISRQDLLKYMADNTVGTVKCRVHLAGTWRKYNEMKSSSIEESRLFSFKEIKDPDRSFCKKPNLDSKYTLVSSKLLKLQYTEHYYE